jgi:hypothetical protein
VKNRLAISALLGGGNDAATHAAPPKFYFFLVPPDAVEATSYEHLAVALAEGFASLGIPFVANVDRWSAAPDAAPLFRYDAAVDPRHCTAVLFTEEWLLQGSALPPGIFDGNPRPLTVYLDKEDGSRIQSLAPGFPPFDLVLRAHSNTLMQYPANFQPWAFGLSNRIIEATDPSSSPGERKQRLFVSYRNGRYPHSVRRYMDSGLLDRLEGRLPVYRFAEAFNAAPTDVLIEHLWRMTGRRHSSHYYAALRESAACACFGGYFITRWPRDERHAVSRVLKRTIGRLHLRTTRITQYDSWRLWESFAAGCATVHLDLAKYAGVLPVMPKNWEHYIGLDLDRIDDDIERMLGEPDLIERIGLAGRTWAIETYGPRPTAERFLALIGARTPASGSLDLSSRSGGTCG